MKRRWNALDAIGFWVLTSVFLVPATFMLILILAPGLLSVTEPIICPDGRPHAYVVSDTDDWGEPYSSVYCYSDRGDFTQVGLGPPLLVVGTFICSTTLAGITLIFLPPVQRLWNDPTTRPR
jgi:hypothetical protein